MHLLWLLPGSVSGGSHLPDEGLLAHGVDEKGNGLQQGKAAAIGRRAQRSDPQVGNKSSRSGGTGREAVTNMQELLFYIFAGLTLLCAFFVVANPFSRNPITSAMFLVLTIA